MIEGIKVSDKWAPISGSPIVNVSRVLSIKILHMPGLAMDMGPTSK